jgi:hypothetical protein
MIIQNQMVTHYMARAGNALSVLGQIESAMLRGGRAAGQQTRQLSAMEQQFRAIGTTIRYALAGGLVFGITGLIGKLNQLQQQLGLIAAIGPTAGINFNNNALNTYLNDIEERAVAARTPIEELNASTINFLSTVQGAKRSEIADIVSEIGITAKLSQTPTEDLTKAITTMNIAAGRSNNLKTINSLLREWFQLISTVPGGIAAAPQIAQQLGPLSSVAQMGRLTPEQIFGFTTGALRFGATPSTALRGTQFFLQSLFMPRGKYKATLAAHGFTARRLEKEGGAQFVMDYLREIQRLGRGRGPTRAQAQRFGAIADVNPDPEAELAPNQQIAGLTREQLRFISATDPRIHGIRTTMVLLAQLQRHGDVAGLGELMRTYNELRKGTGEASKNLKKAQERFREQTQLLAASVTLDVIKTKIATAAAPALNLGARGVEKVGDIMAAHPEESKWGIRGAFAALGILGLGKMVGGRFGLPKFGGGGILGKLGRFGGQGFVLEQAAHDMMRGGQVLGSSPTHPLYVIVVGQIFAGPGNRGIPTGGPGPGPFGGVEKKLPPVAPVPWWRGAIGRAAPWLRAGVRLGFSAGGWGVAQRGLHFRNGKWYIGDREMTDDEASALGVDRLDPTEYGASPAGAAAMRHRARNISKNPAFLAVASGRAKFSDLTPRAQKQVSPLLQKLAHDQMKESLGVANNAMSQIMKAGQDIPVSVTGGVNMTITVDTGKEKKDARVHLPLSTQHEGGKVPISRGKRKSTRVDFTVGGVKVRATDSPGGR